MSGHTDKKVTITISVEYVFLLNLEKEPDEVQVPGVSFSKQAILELKAKSEAQNMASLPERTMTKCDICGSPVRPDRIQNHKRKVHSRNLYGEKLTSKPSANIESFRYKAQVVYKTDKCVHCGQSAMPGSKSCFHCDR